MLATERSGQPVQMTGYSAELELARKGVLVSLLGFAIQQVLWRERIQPEIDLLLQ